MRNSFGVVVAQVDYSRMCFSKSTAACSVEKSRTRAYDGAMNVVSFLAANNCKIRVFSNFKKPDEGSAYEEDRGSRKSYVFNAFINSWFASIMAR
jgi:hypothetical protein